VLAYWKFESSSLQQRVCKLSVPRVLRLRTRVSLAQQHPLFLGNQRLHMHRLEQADPHHLRDPTRIVAVRLADLLRRQQSLHMPCLHADHWQVGRDQPIDQPL